MKTSLGIVALVLCLLGGSSYASGTYGVLCSGCELPADNFIGEPTGHCKFYFQGDGNLVMYKNDVPCSATNTFPTPGFMAMQGDGNLVLYNSDGNPYWATNTFHPGSYLRVVWNVDFGKCYADVIDYLYYWTIGC
jgi:hypothetical protein